MIEKLNTSNISILQTNTAEEIGISLQRMVQKTTQSQKTLVEQASTDPNKVTKVDSFYLGVYNELQDNGTD